jgi:tyrosyl-tRNA synthetase
MIFEELIQRGLIKQSTNHNKIKHLLDNEKISFYIGFDPTAQSLHVGHLLQIVTALRLKNVGHNPIMLVGGATASIGDPSGKSSMRQALDLGQTMSNSTEIAKQIHNIIGDVSIINNIGWFRDINFLQFISEIGRHFSVNNMLRADCFKSRMENGLSFLEFNYMLMQAFDFFELNRRHNCVLQIGGDDQWSNILAGIDLIHKKSEQEAFGLTITLLTNSAGQKMGKTEKGAVWLDKNLTSVFDFFQFWRNLPDSEVMNCFKLLTLLSVEEIDNIPFSTIDEINSAKKRLAFELTKMVHGELEAVTTLRQAEALFEKKEGIDIEAISIQDNLSILDLLVRCNFAKSKSDARNLINGRGISINDITITDPTLHISRLSNDDELIVRKGKKKFCRIIIEDAHVETGVDR